MPYGKGHFYCATTMRYTIRTVGTLAVFTAKITVNIINCIFLTIAIKTPFLLRNNVYCLPIILMNIQVKTAASRYADTYETK